MALVRHANAGNLRAYVLVNNGSEGAPPQTIQALADQLTSTPQDNLLAAQLRPQGIV